MRFHESVLLTLILVVAGVCLLISAPACEVYVETDVDSLTVPYTDVDMIPTALEKKHLQMLFPTVLVRTENGSGSGTIVFSGPDVQGDYVTMVVTANHVIEDACHVEKKWSSFLGRDVKRERRDTVMTEKYLYRNGSRSIGTMVVEADIVARDKQKDLALLQLRSVSPAQHVAKLYPHKAISNLRIFTPVYSVGAQLGKPPLPTYGEIAHLDTEIEGVKCILATAEVVYGSSGGALFALHEMDWQLIGVPVRLHVSGYTPITHMALFVGPWSLYKFLEEHHFEFIYDPQKTIEECEKLRKEKAEKEKRLLPRVSPDDEKREYPY